MAVFNKKNKNVDNFKPVSSTPQTVEKKTVIGRTLKVSGEITISEEILIEGTVDGVINSTGRVVIGRSGFVKAEVNAREVVIKGRLEGDVKGEYKVEIAPEGVLNGNIISQRVVLAEGSVFKGNIDMSVKESSPKKKENKNEGQE